MHSLRTLRARHLVPGVPSLPRTKRGGKCSLRHFSVGSENEDAHVHSQIVLTRGDNTMGEGAVSEEERLFKQLQLCLLLEQSNDSSCLGDMKVWQIELDTSPAPG